MEGSAKTIDKSKNGSKYQGMILLDLFIMHNNQITVSFEQDREFTLPKYITMYAIRQKKM